MRRTLRDVQDFDFHGRILKLRISLSLNPTLYAADEGQRFDVTFTVRRSGRQRVALIEMNRVDAESNFLNN